MHHLYAGGLLLTIFWVFGGIAWGTCLKTTQAPKAENKERRWRYYLRQPTALLFYWMVALTAIFLLIFHYLGMRWGLLSLPLLLYAVWLGFRVRKLIRQEPEEIFQKIYKPKYINNLVYLGMAYAVYVIYYILFNMSIAQ